ncbi:MAG: hypothetical protein IPL61_26015 [Myxococcales bacterium]|nr:hypothetical protein [Myxococcales bacterium]
MRVSHVSITFAWLILAGVTPAVAQTPPAEPPPPPPTPTATDDPAALAAKVDALAADLEDVQGENEDLRSELVDLRERVAASKPPTSLTALNPQITAFLNGAARFDDRPVYTPNGDRVDDRLFMRTLEVELRAAVDPFADAVAILSLENELADGFGVDLEAGYVVIKRLPVLESAPLGLKLKVGRYRAPFGLVNRIHMHDLPWTTRPLPISRFLGNEHGELFEGGWNPVGVDAEVILPEVIPGAVMEVNADVVDGGAVAISGIGADEHHHLGYLGHYNLFFTVADAHDVNLGASAYLERGDHEARLYGVDLLYKWKPVAAGEFHSVVLGGELMMADRRFTRDDGTEARTKPLAGYAFGQVQLSWHTYLGARFDLAQDVGDASITTKVAAGYLSYYTSEFLRFRAGYEHRWSDVPADDGINSFITEVNVVFGSHPTEPYWVNR